MLNVVHYPAMEGGNELLVNDQEYYVGRPAGSDEVLIPRDAWEVIKKQADSFKERDEQMNRVISLLEKRWIKENKADCFWNFQGAILIIVLSLLFALCSGIKTKRFCISLMSRIVYFYIM